MPSTLRPGLNPLFACTNMNTNETLAAPSSETDRPFVMILGRRYNLAPDESLPPDPSTLADGPRWGDIPSEHRNVTVPLRIFLLLRSGLCPQLGWFFLIVATLGLFFIGSVVHFDDMLYDLGGWKDTGLTATIVSSIPLSINEGENRVHEHLFEHKNEDGTNIVGTCFSKKRLIPFIEYDLYRSVKEPVRYRLKNTALSKLSLGSSLALTCFDLFFLLLGLMFVVQSFVKGALAIRLLAYGEKAKAVPVRIENTSVKVNDIPVRKITYVYSLDGKITQTSTKAAEIARITDEGYEILFHDRSNPPKTLLLDELHEKIEIVPGSGFRINPLLLFWPLLFLGIFIWEIAWLIG